jgi:hypothetical protein
MAIWILNEDVFTFSNVGNSSVYLLNKTSEISELTEKDENRNEFSYISSWKLLDWEIVVSSNATLLKYLSKSDLVDWLILADDIEVFNKNITNILEWEILEENIIVSSLKIVNNSETINQWEKTSIFKWGLIKIIDNRFSKGVIWGVLFLLDKLKAQKTIVKNTILVAWIIIWIFLLYSILSNFVNITTQTEEKEVAKNNITEIRDILKIASENIGNDEVFEKNINDAEKLIKEVQTKNLYLNDLAKITDDLNLLKQQFNKVEIFYENENNLVHLIDWWVGTKIIKDKEDTYIIDSKSIIWPIISAQKPQIYTFSNLWENETFVDWVFINSNIYILTNNSKIIRFTKNGYFEYVSTIWQNTWEDIKAIKAYSSNLYTLWTNNQINKHSPNSSNFWVAQPYLKEADVTQIWDILSMAIDWWFYILKKDLSIVKFFSSPYRLEWIILNKLPKNYNIDEEWWKIELKASSNLNYVYLLLNNKIFVFKPNSTAFTDTKSLTYIWQIEWSTKKIKDFYVNYDWEIFILNEAWVYKLSFGVSDDKIIISN